MTLTLPEIGTYDRLCLKIDGYFDNKHCKNYTEDESVIIWQMLYIVCEEVQIHFENLSNQTVGSVSFTMQFKKGQ